MTDYSGDMIVPLANIPDSRNIISDSIKIKRAFPTDKKEIMDFITNNFSEKWAYEAEHALVQNPPSCFIATEKKDDGKSRILGFACYDSSAKGFFGPTGVLKTERGRSIGKALLLHTLENMKAFGYAYAIIGWVGDAEDFYRKTVNAEYIPNGTPKNSVYSNMIFM